MANLSRTNVQAMTLLPARAALTRAAAVGEPKHYVTEEEVSRAADLLEQAGQAERYMFLRFLWLTGARVSEALAVRPQLGHPGAESIDRTLSLPALRLAGEGRPPAGRPRGRRCRGPRRGSW